MLKIARVLVVFAVVLLALLASYRFWASPRPAEITLRHLDKGEIVGFEEKNGTLAWFGIPFAEPPVGQLRWREPQPIRPWQGVFEALERSPMCPQILPLRLAPLYVVGEEDCLYVDVWTPRLSPEQAQNTRLPVMVWIHGGGNILGGSDAADPYRFAKEKNIVVVSLQYRLGLLGWFSHPALRDTSSGADAASSNFALLDQVAALQWVQDNIARFGGDPGNVTVFGQSAGAFNIMALLAAPQANGLFHKAIAQSGYLNTVPRAKAENYVDAADPGLPYSSREYINRLLISNGLAADRREAKLVQDGMADRELVDYLQGKSARELFENVDQAGGLGYPTPSNIRDGIVLPQKPLLEVFSDPRQYNSVPVMIGNNRDEYKLWLWPNSRFADRKFGVLPKIRDPEEYNRFASYLSDHWQASGVNEPARILHKSQPGQVYTYRFDWSEQPTLAGVPMADVFGAAHGIEIVFLFGREAVDTLPLFARASDEHSWEELSNAMLDYWANFAKYGDPGKAGQSGPERWTAWQNNGVKKMVFDSVGGGGIRMTTEAVLVDELKEQLRQDSAFGSDRERCELYAQMFLLSVNSGFWDEAEYEQLGCAAYDPEGFESIL